MAAKAEPTGPLCFPEEWNPSEEAIAFGPVPSRRLGRSLGINNVAFKACTHSCVYCQLGRTPATKHERRPFHPPAAIFEAVRERISQVEAGGGTIDYVTFVPNGEPTLDRDLGLAIELLRPLGYPIAVITNASLVWREDVRADLARADWVSLKIDAVTDELWRRIDRPRSSLHLNQVLTGALDFAAGFRGKLVTETMLVAGLNDDETTVRAVARYVAWLRPATAYLAVPTRPPAEEWVRPPDAAAVNRAYQIFNERVRRVECLIGAEEGTFGASGDVVADLLGITAVHPMREESVAELVERAGVEWAVVRELVAEGRLAEVEYEGRKFFLRAIRSGG